MKDSPWLLALACPFILPLMVAMTAVLVWWMILEMLSEGVNDYEDWEHNWKARREWNEGRRERGLPTILLHPSLRN